MRHEKPMARTGRGANPRGFKVMAICIRLVDGAMIVTEGFLHRL